MVSNSDCSSFHWTEVNMMGNRKYTQLFFAPIRIKGHWVIERTRKKVSFPIINISVHEMIDINFAFYDQTRLGMKVTRNNKMYLLFYSNFEIEYDFMLVKLGCFGNFCPIKRLCLPFRASVQRVPEPDPIPGISFATRPDRLSFENHRVAGNSKYRVLPEILRNTRNTWKYPRLKEIPGNTRSHHSYPTRTRPDTRYPARPNPILKNPTR